MGERRSHLNITELYERKLTVWAKKSTSFRDISHQTMKTQYENYNQYSEDRPIKHILFYILLVFKLLFGGKANGQIAIKELPGEGCNTYFIANISKDSLYFISQCMFCDAYEGCMKNVTYVDSIGKKLTIYISHSKDDLDWVVPNLAILRPGDSISYRIRNGSCIGYDRYFEFFARPLKIKKLKRKYNIRKAVKIKGYFYIYKLDEI